MSFNESRQEFSNNMKSGVFSNEDRGGFLDEQNFKFSFFGGFNKKSVVDYVTKIVDSFNLDIENLKKDYENQLEQKNKKIEKLCVDLQKSDDELKKIKFEFEEFKNSNQHNSDVKKVEEKEALIVKMRAEIADLKKASNNSKNEAVALEERLKKAQTVAKDRINEIVEQARAKIVAEYNQKMEASKREVKAMREEAVKEISKILNDSAGIVHKIVDETRSRIKQFVHMTKLEAIDLVDSANLVGQRIIKQSAETVFSERKNDVVSRMNLDVEVNNIINSVEKSLKIDDELLGAVKKLSADFLLCDSAEGAGVGLKGSKTT